MPQAIINTSEIPTILRKVKKDNTPAYFKKFYNEGETPTKFENI